MRQVAARARARALIVLLLDCGTQRGRESLSWSESLVLSHFRLLCANYVWGIRTR